MQELMFLISRGRTGFVTSGLWVWTAHMPGHSDFFSAGKLQWSVVAMTLSALACISWWDACCVTAVQPPSFTVTSSPDPIAQSLWKWNRYHHLLGWGLGLSHCGIPLFRPWSHHTR